MVCTKNVNQTAEINEPSRSDKPRGRHTQPAALFHGAFLKLTNKKPARKTSKKTNKQTNIGRVCAKSVCVCPIILSRNLDSSFWPTIIFIFYNYISVAIFIFIFFKFHSPPPNFIVVCVRYKKFVILFFCTHTHTHTHEKKKYPFVARCGKMLSIAAGNGSGVLVLGLRRRRSSIV